MGRLEKIHLKKDITYVTMPTIYIELQAVIVISTFVDLHLQKRDRQPCESMCSLYCICVYVISMDFNRQWVNSHFGHLVHVASSLDP